MKKISKLFLTTAFATLLGVGAFAGVSAVKEAKVEKASALPNTGSAGDYIFFTPSSGWASDNCSFKISTFDSNDNTVEGQKPLTLLDDSVFNGKFTTDTVYYYKTTKDFNKIEFYRCNSDGTVQHNYSGKCVVDGSKHWVHMGTSNWWNTWTTSNDSGVEWKETGDLTVRASN